MTIQFDACKCITSLQTNNRNLGGNDTCISVCGIVLTLRTTIISICLWQNSDGQYGLGDGQLTRIVGNRVVAGSFTNGSSTRRNLQQIFTLIGFLTIQGNAGELIAALQTLYRHLGGDDTFISIGGIIFTLRSTVINIALVNSGNGKFRLVDGQLASCISNGVVARLGANSGSTRDNLAVIFTLIGFPTIQGNAGELVATLQTRYRHFGGNVASCSIGGIILTLRRCVISIALSDGSDGQSSGVHGQSIFTGLGRMIRCSSTHLHCGGTHIGTTWHRCGP